MIDCIEKQQQQQQQYQLHQRQHQHQFQAQVQPVNLDMSRMSGSQQQHTLLSICPQISQPIHHQRAQVDTTNPNNNQQQQSGNELIGYYFGSISRETAEWILKTHGQNLDGAYLLRSSGANDDFVLSLMVVHKTANVGGQQLAANAFNRLEVLHYKIVETEDSFVALHGQVGDEKFATIDELIDKAQGVATKPRWPIHRQPLESQILPPTYWGLTVDQIRLAILLKAKQWGFPLLSSLFQPTLQQEQSPIAVQQQISMVNNGLSCLVDGVNSAANNAASVTTLNNETIRTLIYKSLHEFQPWFHGKISREEAERRIEEGSLRDGRFLVRERDNYSYAMCISHKKTTKHYRIDVLPTGELAIQDGRKFTSLMALVSHYTIMSDGLWCALTEACARPIQVNNCFNGTTLNNTNQTLRNSANQYSSVMNQNQNLYCVPPVNNSNNASLNMIIPRPLNEHTLEFKNNTNSHSKTNGMSNQLPSNEERAKGQENLICSHQGSGTLIKGPIKEWLQTINHKWTQLLAKNQHQSLNSFLFGNQNPLNNHCGHNHHRHNQHHLNHRRKCKNGHTSCGCIQQIIANQTSNLILPNQTHNNKSINQAHLNRSKDQESIGSVAVQHNCCSIPTICPGIKNPNPNALQIIPKQLSLQGNHLACDQTVRNLNTNTLLSYLPQNSGFALNSQSFIGSPLFAVNVSGQLDKNQRENDHTSGSSTNSGSSSNNIGEEKLISPAQSVSVNLNNNPYNLSTDIYGSQTSTAVVNDKVLTSSSSSSGTNHTIHNLRGFNHVTQAHHQYGGGNAAVASKMMRPKETSASGRILCGQHAGPAYRYTNCDDENSCYHRPPLTSYRTVDDSQLITPSTQLTGQAAMAKFVQFQDGQCLRTHRDTRSIHMAYLSSKQQAPPHNNSQNNPLPVRELNTQHRENIQSYLARNNLPANSNNTGLGHPSYLNNNLQCNGNFVESGLKCNQTTGAFNQVVNINSTWKNNANLTCNDLDLMDCGEDDNDFGFKYDPKMIKSSSIETLCGIGVEESLENFKTNRELVMSLQPCWVPNPPINILNPIQINPTKETVTEVNDSNGQGSILSSLIGAETSQNERIDNVMKKKHDLDELTTALLAELTASLKAQVDLKNKQSGFILHNLEKLPDNNRETVKQDSNPTMTETNPLALISEFDTLASNNR